MRGMQQELVISLVNGMSLRLAISLPAYYCDLKQQIQAVLSAQTEAFNGY